MRRHRTSSDLASQSNYTFTGPYTTGFEASTSAVAEFRQILSDNRATPPIGNDRREHVDVMAP